MFYTQSTSAVILESWPVKEYKTHSKLTSGQWRNTRHMYNKLTLWPYGQWKNNMCTRKLTLSPVKKIRLGSPKWFSKINSWLSDFIHLHRSFLSDFSDTNVMLITWVVPRLWFLFDSFLLLPQFAHEMQIREILRFKVSPGSYFAYNLIFRNLILHSKNNRPNFL